MRFTYFSLKNSLFFRVVASSLTLPLSSPLSSQVLRVPWFEWRDDLRREEKAEYLAHLLYRDAGLTLKDATVVPGGVLMSRRTEGDDAPGSPEMRAAAARRDGSSSTGGGVSSSTGTSASASMSDAEVDSLFDDIAEDVGLGGMEAFVARVKSDGGNIRVNRTGGVVVEGAEASDEEEVKLRNTRFGDRLRSRPGATMGFADGPKNDVAPYGMNLESGGGRKGYRPARGRNAGGGGGGGGGSSSTASTPGGGSSSSTASRGSTPGSASRSTPGSTPGSASESKPRAASVARRSAAGTAGSGASPGTGASRGVPVRRRRVRVSVPNGNDAAARGRALGRSSPARRAADSTVTPASDSSSTGASRWASSSIGGLKGVGPGSVAALEGLGVRTVEELAALSDAAVADIKAKKPLLKVSSLRNIARRALEGDGEGK